MILNSLFNEFLNHFYLHLINRGFSTCIARILILLTEIACSMMIVIWLKISFQSIFLAIITIRGIRPL
jgi:hypothetical protein